MIFRNEEKQAVNRAKSGDIGDFHAKILVEPNWVSIGDIMASLSAPLRFPETRPTAPL